MKVLDSKETHLTNRLTRTIQVNIGSGRETPKVSSVAFRQTVAGRMYPRMTAKDR